MVEELLIYCYWLFVKEMFENCFFGYLVLGDRGIRYKGKSVIINNNGNRDFKTQPRKDLILK